MTKNKILIVYGRRDKLSNTPKDPFYTHGQIATHSDAHLYHFHERRGFFLPSYFPARGHAITSWPKGAILEYKKKMR